MIFRNRFSDSIDHERESFFCYNVRNPFGRESNLFVFCLGTNMSGATDRNGKCLRCGIGRMCAKRVLGEESVRRRPGRKRDFPRQGRSGRKAEDASVRLNRPASKKRAGKRSMDRAEKQTGTVAAASVRTLLRTEIIGTESTGGRENDR